MNLDGRNLPAAGNLEAQLRDALRRQDAPEGFAERVLRELPATAVGFRKPVPRRRFAWTWAAAAAAVAVLAMSASIQYRHIQEKRAADEAVQALQIVAEELVMVQNEVLDK